MADVVFVRGLEVSCRVGVMESERRVARRLLIDLEAEADCRPAARTDDLGQALDYVALSATAREVAAGRPYRLIETLAEALSAAVLARYPSVSRVSVRIEKRAAVAGSVAVGVMIERRRAGAP